MNIAQALNERRVQLAISQQELAEYIGYKNRSSISLLEKEEREWTFINVVKACELLELNLHFIEKDRCPSCNQETVDYTSQTCVSCGCMIEKDEENV